MAYRPVHKESGDCFAQSCLPGGVIAQRNCWAKTLFFCPVKNSFRAVLKLPSEEIPLGTAKQTFSKHSQLSAFLPKSGNNTHKIANRHLMEGVSHGTSAEPVQAILVPPRFFRDALTELKNNERTRA